MKTIPALGLALVLTFANASSQAQTCLDKERYTDAESRCTDPKLGDVILLGYLRIQEVDGAKRAVLHDEKLGDVLLLLTPGLVQAIDESPAESYEVEGAMVGASQIAVKSLRPIE